MPRVSTKKKNKSGKAESYRCDSCAEPIVAGQSYYEWSFRYGGTHRQHTEHAHPKQSQLTQSKMSGVYSAIEAAEEALGSATCTEDIREALNECATEVESVKDEYQESIDAMISPDGAVAQECQEKIDALETFKDELESASSDVEDFEEHEPEEPEEPKEVATHTPEQFQREYDEWKEAHTAWEAEHAEWQTRHDEHLDEQRSPAEEALGNLSI
jgi:hypothetical protein